MPLVESKKSQTRDSSHQTDNFELAWHLIQKLQDNIDLVIQDNTKAIQNLLTALIAGGHVLLEDVPGTGKSTLAKSLAKSITADFSRIQFTPDLLPTDILGVSIYNQALQDFEFRAGPIFTQILLADEINRASPRTQAALLEAMGEQQISIDGKQYPMDPLFFVMATQNPIEFHGTYPLPEAQMDRFAMKFSLGYIGQDQEVAMLDLHAKTSPIEDLKAVIESRDLITIRQAAQDVRVSDEVKHYIVSIVAATRKHKDVLMGASPRASLMLLKCAQAMALLNHLDYVNPDMVQALAGSVINHRLALHSDAEYKGITAASVVTEILQSIDPPG